MAAVSRTPRSFLPPRNTGVSEHLTLDDMERYEHVSSPLGDWSRRVLGIERERLLDEMGIDRLLPRGVVDSDDEGGILVAALVNQSGQVWSADGWTWPDAPVEMSETVDMDEAAVAFVARAQMEGADAVLFREAAPLGMLAAGEESVGQADTPPGSVIVAVVDGLDRDAVLELLAIAPGPEVYRRHDGEWHEDEDWVQVLKSVQPPPMVKLDDPSVLQSTITQVDTATEGAEFIKFKAQKERDKYITASSFLQELQDEHDAALVQSTIALIAVAGRQVTPKDTANTEQLRRYWLYGKGAAKIRWGTPGAWTRCRNNLIKHLGPKMTPGYCTELSKRLGGPGVATHVGDN